MDLAELQARQLAWRARNFPNQRPHEALLGLAEEVGELSHAHLKGEQGIRHTPEEVQKMKEDAVGDIAIYLASYCNTNGINLQACVEREWEKVEARDWVSDPIGGGQNG